MKRTPKHRMVLLAVALLAGCAVGGQPYGPQPPPPGQSTVVVYRPKAYVGGGVSPMLVDNGAQIGRIGNGQFIRHVVEPGRHKIHCDTMNIDQPAEFDAEAGQVYYLKVFLQMGAFANTWHAARIYPEQAEAELRTCCKSGK